MITRRSFFLGAFGVGASLALTPSLSACSSGDDGPSSGDDGPSSRVESPSSGVESPSSGGDGPSSGDDGPIGTWYGVTDYGECSTLELNKDGTWLYIGSHSGSGEWSETDSGTIVLSAPLISIPFTLEGTGDDRALVFAGEDPTRGNAPEISRSTYYATEAARDAASGKEG